MTLAQFASQGNRWRNVLNWSNNQLETKLFR